MHPIKPHLYRNLAPRWLRCYDNGGLDNGGSFDRFTVVFTRKRLEGWTQYRAMSVHPCHPQGFGQWGEVQDGLDTNKDGFAPAMGRRCHLGQRIPFEALPDDCQELVRADYRKLWNCA